MRREAVKKLPSLTGSDTYVIPSDSTIRRSFVRTASASSRRLMTVRTPSCRR
jgi:hypothetical protein